MKERVSGRVLRWLPGVVGGAAASLLAVVAFSPSIAGRQGGNIDASLPKGVAATADRCDPIGGTYCMFPFPNDFFTVADANTDTGRRLSLSRASLPVSNLSGRAIDPAEWNRNDGFSPGSMILVQAPGVDLGRSGASSSLDLKPSLSPDGPIQLIDATTLERQIAWAELDTNTVSSPDRQALTIRPAKNLRYGHRYIVVLRNLKDAGGRPLQANAAFRIYRDHLPTAVGAIESRRAHMESLFATLGKAGVDRSQLYLAWDFTVASQRNMTGRMQAIRDDAFRALGDSAPKFSITKVTDFTPTQNARLLRQVEGVMEVPVYVRRPELGAQRDKFVGAFQSYFKDKTLDVPAVKAAYAGLGEKPDLPRFIYASATPGVNDTPLRDGQRTMSVPFLCNIPRSVLSPAGKVQPSHASIYGHGFFGSRGELNAKNVADMGDEHDFTFCAVNWYGFSENDVPEALMTFADLSNTYSFFDMTQQGILNQLFLARLMHRADGLASSAPFRMGAGNESVLDTSAVYYDGNSQGGIIGGTVMAMSQDIRRGVLGVPGMNYSLLSERSKDFDIFGGVLYAAYPDSLDQELVFSLWQVLWDRAEGNGYAAVMTDTPLPGTPAHQVLLHVAYGDHQVAMISAEVEARSIGAKMHCPATAPFRSPGSPDTLGLSCIDYGKDGASGSAMVIWDSGSRVSIPPAGDLPPTTGTDPHEDPRATAAARKQKAIFLTTGRIVDVCDKGPCVSDPK